MSEQKETSGVIVFRPVENNTASSAVIINPTVYTPTRIHGDKIETRTENRAQYDVTIEAVMIARLPLSLVTSAAKHLEDKVESIEIDVPLRETASGKVGEIARNEDTLMGWQTRGVRVSITGQLASPEANLAQIIPFRPGIIVSEPTPEQTIEIFEGIYIVSNKPQTLDIPVEPLEIERAA